MPRSKDERKYSHARELLKSSLSINDIREQLITLYGSAISPNKLLEMKGEITPKKKLFSRSTKKLAPESVPNLSQLDRYNSLLNDIDRKLEQHIFLIFNKIEMLDKSLTHDVSTEIQNLHKKTAETNFFQYFKAIKNAILEFLTHRDINFAQIVSGLELSEDITALALADLEKKSQLLITREGEEVTYHKKPKDYQEIQSHTAEGQAAPQVDPRTQLEIEEIKDALDDPLRGLRSQLILKGKDTQASNIIHVALDQLATKWKNLSDD